MTYRLSSIARFDLQGYPRSMIFYLIRKGVCDFLLIIDGNLSLISHRFSDTASFRLENAHFFYPFY